MKTWPDTVPDQSLQPSVKETQPIITDKSSKFQCDESDQGDLNLIFGVPSWGRDM